MQHPDLISRLALISIPSRRDGWFPVVRAAFDQMGDGLFEQMRHSPMYAGYAAVAPDVDRFPELMNKTGELLRRPYDCTADPDRLPAATLLLYADNHNIPVAHMADFYARLGGGDHGPGWDSSGPGRSATRLAIVPGTTHYDVAGSSHTAALLDEHFA